MSHGYLALVSIALVVLVLFWSIATLWRAAHSTYHIGTGAACGKCGYRLKHIGEKQRCSECGTELLKAGITTEAIRSRDRPGFGIGMFALVVLAVIIGSFVASYFERTRPTDVQTRGTRRYLPAGAGLNSAFEVGVDVWEGATDRAAGTIELRITYTNKRIVLDTDGRVLASNVGGVNPKTLFGDTSAAHLVATMRDLRSATLPEGADATVAKIVAVALTDPAAFVFDGVGTNAGTLAENRLSSRQVLHPRFSFAGMRGRPAITAAVVCILVGPFAVGVWWLRRRRDRFARQSYVGASFFQRLGFSPAERMPDNVCCEMMARQVNANTPDSSIPVVIGRDDGKAYGFLRGIDLVPILHCPWCGARLGDTDSSQRNVDAGAALIPASSPSSSPHPSPPAPSPPSRPLPSAP